MHELVCVVRVFSDTVVLLWAASQGAGNEPAIDYGAYKQRSKRKRNGDSDGEQEVAYVEEPEELPTTRFIITLGTCATVGGTWGGEAAAGGGGGRRGITLIISRFTLLDHTPTLTSRPFFVRWQARCN